MGSRKRFFLNDQELKEQRRLIYLMKTCYNGLYRVSKKNYFNTPMGNYKSPLICDVPTLNACYKFLNDKNVAIYNQDYASLLDMIPDNSFVYLDPPYFPVSKTANFTSYQSDKFKETEQFRLLDFCMNLHKRENSFLIIKFRCARSP